MSLQDMVTQVKELQRSDNNARECWKGWCDDKNQGIKDPNKHDLESLVNFLEAYMAGQLKAPPASAYSDKGKGGSFGSFDKGFGKGKKGDKGYGKGWGKDYGSANAMVPYGSSNSWGGGGDSWGGGGGGGSWGSGSGGGGKGDGHGERSGAADLAEMVRMGQRLSPNWKKAWGIYCDMYMGENKNDPRKHSKDHLVGFIDYLGQVANTDLETAAGQSGISIKRVNDGGAPPPKRAPGSDLVSRVKSLQRASQDVKEAWWTMCDNELNGIRDPARHESVVLEGFLLQYEHTVPGYDPDAAAASFGSPLSPGFASPLSPGLAMPNFNY